MYSNSENYELCSFLNSDALDNSKYVFGGIDPNVNQYCDFLHTVLDKHTPPSLQKIINHNSSPWFESI